MNVRGRGRIIVALLFGISLLFTFTSALAQSDRYTCAQEHTVQVGETLTGIAAHYGLTLAFLLELNPIPNPNLIPVGRVLCVSAFLPTAEPSSAVAQSHETPNWMPSTEQHVVLSIDYQFGSQEDDTVLFGTSAGLIGLRRSYPLENQGVEIFPDSNALLAALGPQPVILYGIRSGENAYALIEPVKGISILSPPLSGCPVPPSQRLSTANVISATVNFVLEETDGNGMTFPIAELGQQPPLGGADECGVGTPAFVLSQGRTTGLYRLLVAESIDDDTSVQEQTSTSNLFVIESTYTVSDSQSTFPLVQQMSKRLVFPLPSAAGIITGVRTLSETTEVAATLSDPIALQPIYFGVKLSDRGPYRLVAVGDRQLLAELGGDEESVQAMDDTCRRRLTEAALSGEHRQLTRITAYLETDGGLRMPFPIAEVSYAFDVVEAVGCATDTVFVLRPNAAGDGYQLTILLTESGYGPPGEFRAQSCARWRYNSGFRYRLMRRVFGCR